MEIDDKITARFGPYREAFTMLIKAQVGVPMSPEQQKLLEFIEDVARNWFHLGYTEGMAQAHRKEFDSHVN